MRRRYATLAALVGATVLTGCGSDDKDSGTPGADATAVSAIRIAQFLYEPDPVTVKAGTDVAISNADSAPHTLTEKSPSPAFDSGTIRGNARGSVTFTKPGTFAYFCEFHATMKGTVTVVR